MKTTRLLLLSLCLGAVGSPATAQIGAAQPAATQEQPGPEDRPLEQLMEVRAELGLSDPQMQRLQAIALRLEQTNGPLWQELQRQRQTLREQKREELLRMPPAERQAEIERIREQGHLPPTPAMQQLAQQIRANIAGALREAGTVLTPGQRQRAREMIQARRQQRMGGGMGGRRGGFGRRMGPRAGRP